MMSLDSRSKRAVQPSSYLFDKVKGQTNTGLNMPHWKTVWLQLLDETAIYVQKIFQMKLYMLNLCEQSEQIIAPVHTPITKSSLCVSRIDCWAAILVPYQCVDIFIISECNSFNFFLDVSLSVCVCVCLFCTQLYNKNTLLQHLCSFLYDVSGLF